MEQVKLTDICKPKQWKTIPTNDLLKNGFPVYGANGVIGYYKEYNHKDSVVTITCRGATCGTVNITEPKSYINGNAMCLDNLRQDIMQKYLYYCLSNYDFTNVISGSAQPQITRQGLEKVVISIGTKEEQTTIVALLDKVNSIIDARQQQLAKLDELAKARFVEMFIGSDESNGWSQCTISDVSADMRTGPFGSALHHDEFVDKGVFVLGIDNAVENKFSYNKMRYITQEKYCQLKRYTVFPGDVIITIMGTVGRSAVIPDDIPKAINTKHLACITVDKEKINPYFLSSAFQIHPGIRAQLQKESKGAIMNGLNLTIIKGLSFKCPPLALQEMFVAFYKQNDKVKLSVQNSIEQMEILKKALMQQYFE